MTLLTNFLPSDKDRTGAEVPWLLVAIIIIHVTFGLVLVWKSGPEWPLAMLWASACAIVGNATGFLFGIPRTLQGTEGFRQDMHVRTRKFKSASGSVDTNSQAHLDMHPAAPAATDDTYHLQVNTNLEQISDWLTKILVGVGLTQIHSLPGELHNAAVFIAGGLGSSPRMINFALALLIYFPLLGFLSGYLCTRLFLQPAFRHWDRGAEGE